ncbi:hypothetical protein GBA63_19065 [Rubrobacter tropicus]|uniref:Uncharacterized protein n=1 Tax=Rubrobacter tropicus TaxID=2653851 RepID=A0A6G8QDC7_9ACTN|nr:hypothetical protein [Rubrobacter tropicus]QIN84510.1 hypothetical protein GBA63_19065 [Rubrobacter tropicus]
MTWLYDRLLAEETRTIVAGYDSAEDRAESGLLPDLVVLRAPRDVAGLVVSDGERGPDFQPPDEERQRAQPMRFACADDAPPFAPPLAEASVYFVEHLDEDGTAGGHLVAFTDFARHASPGYLRGQIGQAGAEGVSEEDARSALSAVVAGAEGAAELDAPDGSPFPGVEAATEEIARLDDEGLAERAGRLARAVRWTALLSTYTETESNVLGPVYSWQAYLAPDGRIARVGEGDDAHFLMRGFPVGGLSGAGEDAAEAEEMLETVASWNLTPTLFTLGLYNCENVVARAAAPDHAEGQAFFERYGRRASAYFRPEVRAVAGQERYSRPRGEALIASPLAGGEFWRRPLADDEYEASGTVWVPRARERAGSSAARGEMT